jgi:hypothetical protein
VGQTFGAEEPDGYVGNLHGPSGKNGQLVSLITCGGLRYGYVRPKDVLGPGRKLWGSSSRCPRTGEHVFAGEGRVTATHRCPQELPITLETGTLSDRVGTLAAGGSLRVDDHSVGTRTLVTPVDSPVALGESARFSVETAALGQCEQL